MINPCEAIYTGDDLIDAALGITQFRSPGGTIKAVYLYVKENVSDDAVFNISKNNVALWTLEDRLTILDGEASTDKTDLNIATARGDILQLDLEEVPESGIAAPITLILDIDDGVELPEGNGLTTEAVQDIVGAMMVSGTNTLWTYDDAAGTLKVDAANLSDEDIQDKVAAMLAAGTNVTVNYNDPAGTLTISSATRTDEEIQDVVAALLQQGSNVTLTYNDAGNSLTIAASGGGTSLPSQTGNAGKFLKTDGTNASWDTPAGGDSSGGSSTWTTVKKTADEGRTLTTVLTPDGQLKFEADANSIYQIRLCVSAYLPSGVGMKWKLSRPSVGGTTRPFRRSYSYDFGYNSAHLSGNNVYSDQSIVESGYYTIIFELVGTVSIGSVGGTVSFDYAQANSSAEGMAVQKGGYLEYYKL